MLAFIVKNDEIIFIMSYPGGKSRSYQYIINLIPPHRVYIETHLGGGAVMRYKAAADLSIGIDRDPRVIELFQNVNCMNYQFIVGRAEDFLSAHHFDGTEFVYLDPPYWPASRRSERKPYKYDYTEAEHIELLKLIRALPCPVMISGYRNSCYDENLCDWNRYDYFGTSRIGKRKESVWLNYKPDRLHDLRYLGCNFRERQSIKRRRYRWAERFRCESRPMQQALLSDFMEIYSSRESI